MVDRLLEGGAELEAEPVLVPDVAVPEVMNAIYVHDRVLHLIGDGAPYLDRLFRVIDAELIRVVECSRELVLEAYQMASRHGGGAYDCLFVALALRSGARLKTRDRRQAKIMEAEAARRRGGGAQS